MPRDSILDKGKDAEQTDTQTQDPDPEPDGDGETDDASQDQEKIHFTARVPADLIEDVERVQEEYGLPHRMATINFLLRRATKDA